MAYLMDKMKKLEEEYKQGLYRILLCDDFGPCDVEIVVTREEFMEFYRDKSEANGKARRDTR